MEYLHITWIRKALYYRGGILRASGGEIPTILKRDQTTTETANYGQKECAWQTILCMKLSVTVSKFPYKSSLVSFIRNQNHNNCVQFEHWCAYGHAGGCQQLATWHNSQVHASVPWLENGHGYASHPPALPTISFRCQDCTTKPYPYWRILLQEHYTLSLEN